MIILRTPLALAVVALLTGCASTSDMSNVRVTDMTYSEPGWAYNDVVNKDWTKAEALLAEEVKSHPDDPFRLLNLAYVYTQADKPDDAVAVYERVLDLDENPIATLLTGEDVRAKKIAEDALASIVTK